MIDNSFAYDPSGCTAIAALVTEDNRIIVVGKLIETLSRNSHFLKANAGDSRGILSIDGKVKPLSYDHKPTDEAEMERIVKAGGFVEFGRVNGKESDNEEDLLLICNDR